MVKCLVVLSGVMCAVLATIVPARADTRVQFFPVYSDGQRTFVWDVQLKCGDGFEYWHYEGTAGRKDELVSPKVQYKGRSGRLTAGLYARMEDGRLSRYGTAGTLTLGKKSGWQLTGPYYIFQQRGKTDFADAGFWTPNLRLTRPISSSVRLGAGMALTTIERRKPSLVVGPYTQVFFSKTTNLQFRFGRFLAPSKQAGDAQLYSGITKEF